MAVWAIWFGLVGGTLEVATRVLCRAIDPAGRLYLMSRHFLWLTPLANVSLFFVLGLLLAGMARFWPRSGGWISLRLLCALAIQPMLILTAPRIYPQALFVLALGISTLLAPMLESRPRAQRRSVLVWSFPALWGLVLVLAVSIAAGDWIKQYREVLLARSSAGFTECPVHRPGHGACRPAQPLRLPAFNVADAGAAGPTRRPFR